MAKVSIPHSTKINSLWSVWYCVLVTGFQIYIAYVSISRYNGSKGEKWILPTHDRSQPMQPGSVNTGYDTPASRGSGAKPKSAPPAEIAGHVTLICLAVLAMPFFVVVSVLRVGNYANDGVKFGRDHVLRSDVDMLAKKGVRAWWGKMLWRHLVPISQTLHLLSALCLLLPDTLQASAEIRYGYRNPADIWKADMSFLFSRTQPTHSHLRATGHYNATTLITNLTILSAISAQKWSSSYVIGIGGSTISPAYVNFVAALLAFSVRYPAVYWYTNKVISCLFAVQLLALTLDSMFAYCGVSVLYKLTQNSDLYLLVNINLSAASVTVLYVFSGLFLLLSSMTIFEYGFYFFHEKFKVVEQKHHPTLVKQTIIVRGTCHGYIPHSCAMIALVLLAVLKGPLIYSLVQAYRHTQDRLVLTCIVIDVFYMLFWVALWIAFTIKQQWQFRILDYMSVGNPVFTIENDHATSGCYAESSMDHLEVPDMRRKKKIPRPAPTPPHTDVAMSDRTDSSGTPTEGLAEDDSIESGIVTHSDTSNQTSDSGSNMLNGVLVRKSKNRRSIGQRVTFNETVKTNVLSDEEASTRGKSRAASQHEATTSNITAEIHDQSNGQQAYQQFPKGTSASAVPSRMSPDCVKNDLVRPKSTEPDSRDSTITRDYRKNIRDTCDEMYPRLSPVTSPSASPVPEIILGQNLTVIGSRHSAALYSNSPRSSSVSPIHKTAQDNNYTSMPHLGQEPTVLPNYSSSHYGKPYDRSSFPSNRISPQREDAYKRNSTDSPAHLLLQTQNNELGFRTNAPVYEVNENTNSFNQSNVSKFDKRPVDIAISNGSRSNIARPLSPESRPDIVPTCSNSKTQKPVPNSQGNRLNHVNVMPRPLRLVPNKAEIGRRDSANYSMTSSQETSSNDSDHGLCSQV